ncbi:MAG TPA: hypothetical protein VF958_06285 [Thermoanaerobaculia bacterium]
MSLRRFAALAAGILLWLSPAAVRAHKDDYLADTFVFLTLEARELELEYWLDAQDGPRGLLHTWGAEYGITDHLMADLSARWLEREGGPTTFRQGFFELRYRFGEEGRHVLDPAASVEYEIRRSPDGARRKLLEPRIVLSRDFAGWNATLNLFYAIVVDETRRSAFEGAAGLRSPAFGRWSGGLEIRREVALENETLVIPQVWFRISPEAYVKAGGGKNFAREKNAFVRIAFEIEL